MYLLVGIGLTILLFAKISEYRTKRDKKLKLLSTETYVHLENHNKENKNKIRNRRKTTILYLTIILRSPKTNDAQKTNDTVKAKTNDTEEPQDKNRMLTHNKQGVKLIVPQKVDQSGRVTDVQYTSVSMIQSVVTLTQFQPLDALKVGKTTISIDKRGENVE